MNLHALNIIKKIIKPKVLLRSMGARRDAGYCLVLKAMLENYGYRVFISCVRNFDFALKFWSPDIVILSNFSGAERVKKISPNSFLVYLEGEGFNTYDSYMADFCFKNRHILKLDISGAGVIFANTGRVAWSLGSSGVVVRAFGPLGEHAPGRGVAAADLPGAPAPFHGWRGDLGAARAGEATRGLQDR